MRIEKASAVWGTPGGKRLLAKKLAGMIPAHVKYVEPFVGAGSVFFAKQPSEKEVLGDVDENTVFAFQAIQKLTDPELKKLEKKNWVGSAGVFDKLKKSKPRSRVERLYKFLYVRRFSFFRKDGHFGDYAGVEAMLAKKLPAARERLQGVKIVHASYTDAIAKHDGKDTLFFFDPPYPNQNVGYSGDDGSFDEEEFFKLLGQIEGKFIVTMGTKGRKDWGPFHVRKISHHRTAGRQPNGDGVNTLLTNLVITNFTPTRKDLGGGWFLHELDKAFPSGEPEAGMHLHTLDRANDKTANDGAHKHAFKREDGTILWTEEDGEHEHGLQEGIYFVTGGQHAHKLIMPGEGEEAQTVFTSGEQSWHDHDLQSTHTAFDGMHTHTVQIGAELLQSLTGKDIYELEGGTAPASPPASALAAVANGMAGPAREMDSFVIGEVSIGADGDVYVDSDDPAAAVLAAMGKRLDPATAARVRVHDMAPPTDHAQVAEVVIRPVRGELRSPVVEGDVVSVDDSHVALDGSGVVLGRFGSKATANKVLAEVATMRADGDIPSSISWSSVESGALPPFGFSGLPASVEKQVPEHLRFWRMENRQDALAARDALVDSGFALSLEWMDDRLVSTRVTKTEVVAKDLASLSAKPAGFKQVIVELAGNAAAWTSDDYPVEDIEVEHPIAVRSETAQRWASEGVLEEAAQAFAKHAPKGALIAAPDSIAARAAFANVGIPYKVKRVAMRNMVLCSIGRELHASYVEELPAPMQIAFESETRFQLGKADGKNYLVIGDDAFILQSDLAKGATWAVSAEIPDSFEPTQTGDATDRDDGIFRVMKLSGIGEFAARKAGNMWRITKDAAPEGIRMRIITKAADDDDERFIFSEVLVPERVDAHGHAVSAEEIRAASHDFMIRHQTVKLQHQQITKQIVIVESYLSLQKMKFGDDEFPVGTWFVGAIVLDKDLWKQFKRRDYTAWSMGGRAHLDPL